METRNLKIQDGEDVDVLRRPVWETDSNNLVCEVINIVAQVFIFSKSSPSWIFKFLVFTQLEYRLGL